MGPRHDALLVLALVRARRGDPESWALLDEAQEIAASVGDLQFLAPAAGARAEAAWLEGRPDGVLAETEEAFALALRLGELSFLGELACWRARAGALPETIVAAPRPTRGHCERRLAARGAPVARSGLPV